MPQGVEMVEARISAHEQLCAQRWTQILDRMSRMETIIWLSAGSLIIGMAGLIVTLVLKVG